MLRTTLVLLIFHIAKGLLEGEKVGAGEEEMEVETEAEVEVEVGRGLTIDLFRHSTKLPSVVVEDMEEGKEVGAERRTPPV